jgi:DNA primase
MIIKKYYRNFFKNKIFENLIKKNKSKLSKFQITNSFDLTRLDMLELEIKEFSLCQLLIKFPEFSAKNIEKISEISLSLELTKNIRSKIIDVLIGNENFNLSKINEYLASEKIKNIDAFFKFSSTNTLMEDIDQDTFINLIDDYEEQLNKIHKTRKIEELEKSFSSNMSEQAFNELISLKNSNNL